MNKTRIAAAADNVLLALVVMCRAGASSIGAICAAPPQAVAIRRNSAPAAAAVVPPMPISQALMSAGRPPEHATRLNIALEPVSIVLPIARNLPARSAAQPTAHVIRPRLVTAPVMIARVRRTLMACCALLPADLARTTVIAPAALVLLPTISRAEPFALTVPRIAGRRILARPPLLASIAPAPARAAVAAPLPATGMPRSTDKSGTALAGSMLPTQGIRPL